jgi:mRNA interferase YafQ
VLSIKYVTKFKKDLKRYQHQTSILRELNDVLKLLLAEKTLPEKYHDHSLSGGYVGMRECHVKPDVLLVYWVDLENKKLVVERLGSHSELF